MRILIATEIWGCTPHVQELAAALEPWAGDVTVVDPYDGTDPGFRDEDAAYAAYLEQGGLDAYARKVREAIPEAGEPVFMIGFSAGAGAVWDVICGEEVDAVRHAVGFYGSAIRTMADRTPRVGVDLVFPDHEPYFNAVELAALLDEKALVRCHVVPQGHGFMNPLSVNYDKDAAYHWTAWLKERVRRSHHGGVKKPAALRV